MTQEEVFRVLRDLGGRAKINAITDECIRRGYIGTTYKPYHLLLRLRKWGLVLLDIKTNEFYIPEGQKLSYE